MIHALLILLCLASAGPSTPKRSRLMGAVPSPANAKVNAAGTTTIHSTTRYSLTVKDESKLSMVTFKTPSNQYSQYPYLTHGIKRLHFQVEFALFQRTLGPLRGPYQLIQLS